MNKKNNREIKTVIDSLALMLESLEEYIRKADIIQDWNQRELFFRRTIPDNEGSLENDEDHFLSQLYLFGGFNCKGEAASFRQEIQKEYYKWIDAVKIKPEECSEKLKHFLIEIDQVLEDRSEKFYQAKSKEVKKFKLDLKNNPEHRKLPVKLFSALQEARYLQKKEVKIEGNIEAGRETLQKIRNSTEIRHEDWTWIFTSLQTLQEQEEKTPKEKPEPKDSLLREATLDQIEDTLRTVELYIQKLNLYPDWKISEWTEKYEDWRKNWENRSAERVKGLLESDLKGLSLLLTKSKKKDPNYYSYLVDELKIKLSQWQSERKIDSINCPWQLKQIFFEINQVLEGSWNWKKNKGDEGNNEDKQEEELAEIIFEIKSKILELATKYKITKLDSQLDNWESKLKSTQSISEAKSTRQQLEQKIQEEERKKHSPVPNQNENKLPLSAKLAIGIGIVGLVLGVTVIVYRVIKNKKVKK